jgi:predicted metal-binding protein
VCAAVCVCDSVELLLAANSSSEGLSLETVYCTCMCASYCVIGAEPKRTVDVYTISSSTMNDDAARSRLLLLCKHISTL